MTNLCVFILMFYNIFNNKLDDNLIDFLNEKYEISMDDFNRIHELTEEEKQYVVHAGGKLDKYTYVNNYEALKNSYEEGYRMIELDVEFTSDNVPVMLHSWDGFITSYFGVESNVVYSYDKFKSFTMINGWHQLSLEDTINCMDNEFKDMYLVTDTKNDNKKLLKLIKDNYSYMMPRIIPQVYNQDEYFYAKDLGFEKVIYTLYLSEDTKEEIIKFSKDNKPFAITMSTSWAYSDLPVQLSKIGVYTYTHTINDFKEYDYLKGNGIKGIYTDTLLSVNGNRFDFK
ncbi:MAG: amidohydrolase [archaeon]|nr:amidohydrolase [archaeon]